MQFVFGFLAIVPPLLLAWGAWTGRAQVRCCGIDARDDKRMASAFEDLDVGPGDAARAVDRSPRPSRAGKSCVTTAPPGARSRS